MDRETDGSRTSTYSYDSRGNLTQKNVYDFTQDENITSSPKETTTFTYANSGWKDQLVSVNGTELTYDANGNVLTYGNKEYTWNTGRNLAQITDGDNTYSYTYDENGIRTSKTVNGVTTYYNTRNGVILSQTDGTNTMYFQYDTNGVPLGFIYNGTQYLYLTNQMGDVVAVTKADGEILAAYEYDEWGKLLYTNYVDPENASTTAVVDANPIRYRGYYYDAETGYYYLQSRYYDASICRFINADIPEIAQLSKEVSYGANLFSYCDNDPINNSDPTGTFGTPIQWAFAIIGALVGVPFGKWVANRLGYYSGWKYWTIRAAVVVGGAVLGWFAGTKLLKLAIKYLSTHHSVLAKMPKFVLWFLGLGGSSSTIADNLYNQYVGHIFSQKHISDGIMKLGSSKRDIFNKVFKIVSKKIKYAQNGSNQIHTKINGYKVTIRFYFKDGQIKSIDVFMGWAKRIIGKLIK